MAKKSKSRNKTSDRQAKRQRAAGGKQPGWRQKMLLGGGILVLVICVGVFIRYRQSSRIAPELKGTINNHYTRGVAGAPVVVKEFSDFT